MIIVSLNISQCYSAISKAVNQNLKLIQLWVNFAGWVKAVSMLSFLLFVDCMAKTWVIHLVSSTGQMSASIAVFYKSNFLWVLEGIFLCLSCQWGITANSVCVCYNFYTKLEALNSYLCLVQNLVCPFFLAKFRQSSLLKPFFATLFL